MKYLGARSKVKYFGLGRKGKGMCDPILDLLGYCCSISVGRVMFQDQHFIFIVIVE